MGELSLAFNQMAENLELSEDRRREMTADIAHELRNPLAVIKARLEAIIDGVHPLEVESIEPILDHAELLNRPRRGPSYASPGRCWTAFTRAFADRPRAPCPESSRGVSP